MLLTCGSSRTRRSRLIADVSYTLEKIEGSRVSAQARNTGSVDANPFYHQHSRPILTRLHSHLRRTRFIIPWRISENLSVLSQSGVRATFEGPILESSHSSLPLSGESVFEIPDNKSSTSRFLDRRQLLVS
jgi:hypothetical protein